MKHNVRDRPIGPAVERSRLPKKPVERRFRGMRRGISEMGIIAGGHRGSDVRKFVRYRIVLRHNDQAATCSTEVTSGT